MLSRTLGLLSVAAALQAPQNAHVAITGPPPLAKAIGARCVEAGAKFSIVPDASSRQAVRDVLENKPPVTHVCDGGSQSAADVSPLFLECCGADLVRWCALEQPYKTSLVSRHVWPHLGSPGRGRCSTRRQCLLYGDSPFESSFLDMHALAAPRTVLHARLLRCSRC